MKRKQFAIYSACIGGYDNILQPETIDDRFDYVLFSEEVAEERIGVWQVRHVDYTNPDKTRVARYVKTHPEELLPEYEATLWLDANIQIASHWVYDRVVELYESGCLVASVKHPLRGCAFDEAYTVSCCNRPWPLESDSLAISWCHVIWREKYPRHNGLFETNILFRCNIIEVKEMDNLWWRCIDNYSKRDQLSFNYALWKSGIIAAFFLPEGEDARTSLAVGYENHSSISIRKYYSLGFWELLRFRIRYVTPRMERKSKKQWHWLYRFVFPRMALWAWGCFYGILYSPFLIRNVIVHRLNK